MPAQVTTQLVDETPVVAIIGNDSLLRQGVQRLFNDAGFVVRVFSPDEWLQDVSLTTQTWYKVFWIHTFSIWEESRYLTLCASLKQISSPLVVITPIFSVPENSSLLEIAHWSRLSKLQSQVIIDCSFYLPSAAFFFGRDIFFEEENQMHSQENQTFSPLSFIVSQLEQKTLLSLQGEIYPQTVAAFLQSITPLLFRPFAVLSIQIKGKRLEFKQVVSHIKEQYQAYFSVALTIRELLVKVENPIPFSTEMLEGRDEDVLRTFVRQLPIVSNSVASTQVVLEAETLPIPKLLEKKSEKIVTHHEPLRPTEDTLRVSKLPTTTQEVQLVRNPEVAHDQRFSVQQQQKQQTQDRTASTSVKQDLQKIFQSTRQVGKHSHVDQLVEVRKKVSKKTKRKQVLFYLGLGVVGLSTGLLFLTGVFLVSASMFKSTLSSAVTAVSAGETFPEKRLQQLTDLVDFQAKSYTAVVSIPQVSEMAQYVELSERFTRVIDLQKQLSSKQNELMQSFLSPEQNTSPEIITELLSLTMEAYQETSSVQGLLENSQSELSDESRAVVLTQLEAERRSLIVAQQVLPLLGEVLAVDGRKTYALLFQNDQELRPTGGFIQALGLVQVEYGSLTQIETMSSYELDKNVLGEVAPPVEITEFLGERTLYFRDSNWNPDFPSSAEQARWFIENARSREIDGILALNTQTVAILLESIGPIELPEFNEIITHKNIRERMEFHSEVVLTDSGIPDYSALILQRILERLKSVPQEKYPLFLTQLYEAVRQQQLLLYSTSPVLQSSWDMLGWSGGVVSPNCPTQLATTSCIVEPIAQFEANVGVNKANYYLEKEVHHEVSLLDTMIQHKRTMTYVNTAQSDSWPKGSYKSYIRLYLPKNAYDYSLSVNSVPIEVSQIKQWFENDRVGIGFYLEVPVQKSREVTLSFSTPKVAASSFSYALFEQKQSGTSSLPYSLSIRNPSATPVLIAPQATVLDENVLFSEEQDAHLFFGVQY